MILRRFLIGGACFLLLCMACNRGDGAPTRPDGRDAPAPRRVAVLAPAAAEMLDALELADRIVAVGEFGPWPAGAKGLPRIGGYDAPNLERLLELECDLLLTTRSRAGSAAHERLAALGVPVAALDTSTYEGVYDSLAEVGRLFDRAEEAAALSRSLRRQVEDLSSRAEGLERPRVLFVVGRDPLYVAGPGSHIDEMIRLVGGSNVAGDALTPYQRLSLEVVLERMPEVIIDASDNRPGSLRGRSPGRWGQWDFLPAVQEDRVFWVEPGRLVIPGLRIAEMTRLMGRLIHPEEYGEPERHELGAAAERPGGGARRADAT